MIMKKSLLFIFSVCLSNILFAQWPKLYFNTYYGSGAFASNISGNYNAAFGNFALYKNTTGNYNTAVGAWALYNSNSTSNVGVGRMAAYNTTTGAANTAIGANAMQNNTTGFANVAIGFEALNHNVGGYWNTAVGQSAGPAFGNGNLYNATAIGYYAINTGNAQVRIGNEFVTDIGGHVSWSTLSDGRYKREIKEDIAGLEFINKLRPVSYTVDEAALAKAHNIPDSVTMQLKAGRKALVRQTGFVAQEVEAIIEKGNYSFNAVNAPQNANDHYSIRYAEFVVPLVKAVQELTAKLDAQETELIALKKQLGISKNKSERAIDYPQHHGAALHQNNPNPFTAGTEISVSLPEDIDHASLIFYTLEGKQLKVLPLLQRGDFSVKLKSSEFTNGLYIYALIADGKMIDTKRLMITGKTH
jgi:hypothetical protein